MREFDPQKLHEIEETARKIGGIIGRVCREQGQGQFGFALMLFSFAGPEATWISNAERADMVKVLHEFIARLEAGTADELSRPKGRG